MKPGMEKRIEDGLRQMGPPRPPTPAGEFWANFKARARMYPQRTPEVGPRSVLVLRWALAAACVLVVAGLTVGGLRLSAGSSGGSAIKSMEVIASHRAVLIMNDDTRDATILWVVGMEDDDDPGDDTWEPDVS